MKIICENIALAQKVKAFAESQGLTVEIVSLEHLSTPTLPFAGNFEGGKVLQFPTPSSKPTKTMSEVEAETIREAISLSAGNLTAAAKSLGIGRATLYRKVKEFNIDLNPSRLKKAA